MIDLIGRQLGNYRLERRIARGAFGDVYLGEHIHLDTRAAIKLLNAQIGAEDIERFRNEARMIVRLIHPNIVRILEFGVEDETPFLIMDYAPGGTLRQRYLSGVQVPLPTIVSYVQQVGDALQYAHDRRLIHRDIKPENMLIGARDEILLSDFGIATVAQSSRYQGAQDIAGTIGYMAPEQIQAHPRAASDQYALGIVVYEWLSGERPFQGSFTEVAVKHVTVPPPPLHEKRPDLSPDVEHVVMTALAKDPVQRFGSVQAFTRAFEQAANAGLETVVSLQSSSPRAHILADRIAPLDVSPSLPSEGDAPVSIDTDQPGPLEGIPPETQSGKGRAAIGTKRVVTVLIVLASTILFALLISRSTPSLWKDALQGLSADGYVPGEAFTTLLGLGLITAIPLFCAVVFGSISGALSGGLGLILGMYISLDYHSNYDTYSPDAFFQYFNSRVLWNMLVYLVLTAIIAGLTVRMTRSRYDTGRGLLLAQIFGLLGLFVGTLVLIAVFDLFQGNTFHWLQFAWIMFFLPGLALLSVLLAGYTKVVKRFTRPTRPAS
ncbi:MAG: serine/threonine protein kinase [Ktedonobacteraceae bacterium]|nr:serine/threonine protein kinase [Ktedonobacteraceae bacterium]